MTKKMASMVKATHKKSRGNASNFVSTKRQPKQTIRVVVTQAPAPAPAQAPANDDMGIGNIIGLGAKTLIGVGLLGGIAGAMNGGNGGN